jgi:hypothetical protein
MFGKEIQLHCDMLSLTGDSNVGIVTFVTQLAPIMGAEGQADVFTLVLGHMLFHIVMFQLG